LQFPPPPGYEASFWTGVGAPDETEKWAKVVNFADIKPD
jgi:hypothetical protein